MATKTTTKNNDNKGNNKKDDCNMDKNNEESDKKIGVLPGADKKPKFNFLANLIERPGKSPQQRKVFYEMGRL